MRRNPGTSSSTARSSTPRPSPTRRSGPCGLAAIDRSRLAPVRHGARRRLAAVARVAGGDGGLRTRRGPLQFGVVHGYGLGLEHYATDSITVVGHLGTGEAHSAFVGYDPVHDTAIAVMTNTAVGGPQGIIAIEALTAVSQAG
jgi:Beta-lactamase